MQHERAYVDAPCMGVLCVHMAAQVVKQAERMARERGHAAAATYATQILVATGYAPPAHVRHNL